MHLGLELDQSKQVSADPKKDIDLALTVLRKRIDEFGVTEPVIQKVGDDRIVVELAGIRDPGRARAIVQKTAFLEFRITDESGALDRAIPAMDRQLRSMGVTSAATPTAGEPSAVSQLLGGDTTPTGILAMSDVLALGALQAASELGVTVPWELSIVGFDDSPAAALATPPLTTVAQPQEEKGRLAAEWPRPQGTLGERVENMSALLTELGAPNEVERTETGWRIQGFGCLLAATVHDRPHVCRAMESLLATLVSVPVRECCDRRDRPRCCFEIETTA